MIPTLRKYFLSGLIVFLPLALTIHLFILVVRFVDGLLAKYMEPTLVSKIGFYFPGLSIIFGILLIVIIGFFVTNFLGRRIYAIFEGLLLRLPFFRQVYPAIKEMAIFLFSRDRMSQFEQVVMVEYPRKGLYSFGFVTQESSPRVINKTGKKMSNVFMPSSPSPLTGFVLMVPDEEIIPTDIKIEDAFKFIVSGGVVNPV